MSSYLFLLVSRGIKIPRYVFICIAGVLYLLTYNCKCLFTLCGYFLCFAIGIILIILHLQTADLIVNKGDDSGEYPACGERHSDGENGVGNKVGNDEKIGLTEGDEGCEHNDHRSCTLADATQSTRVYLIDAPYEIERNEVAHEDSTVIYYQGIGVKNSDEYVGEYQDRNDERCGKEYRNQKSGIGAALRPFDLLLTDILTDEGGRSESKRLHRQHNDLTYLVVGSPAAHNLLAKEVDISLNEDI